ncbi:hypothetical protein [Streptomyces sp. NPDC002788]
MLFRCSSGEEWGVALLIALVATPLALWMGRLRKPPRRAAGGMGTPPVPAVAAGAAALSSCRAYRRYQPYV